MLRSRTLGNQLLLLCAVLLLFPVFLTLYMLHVIQNSELALVEYQKSKLSRAIDELDKNLDGSLKDILKKNGALNKPKGEQVRILNEALRGNIEQVSRNYPRVDMGFYSLELDVIIDGSQNYEENFSRRRKALFQQTLAKNQMVIQTLGQVGAGILEIYKPFYRNGRLEGIIWAYENMAQTNFYKRVEQVKKNCYTIIVVGAVFGLSGAMFLIRNFVKNVNQIKEGVKLLEYDLYRRLPNSPGEMGEISAAVNKLASKLIEVNKYNEIMLATIDDGLVVIDSAGKIVIANHAAIQLLGLNPQWQEKNFKEVFPEQSPFPELLLKTLKNKEQLKDLMIHWPAQQGTQQLLVSTALMLDDRQELIGAVLCCRDVTERMRLEERLHHQERLASLGKLIAGVAHEIRNPLTSISCYIQLWQKTNNPSPKSIKTIYQEVSRLESLVAQLLYFTRPAEAQFVPYNLNNLVGRALQFFTDIHLTKFHIITNLDEHLPLAWIDPEQIERVLMNIIFNACQAMPEGGTLKVETAYHPQDNSVEVAISDTGCGIEEEHLKYLFDPFFSTREKGTGLGLAIANEIVQAHGGQIKVESKAGEGTTFRIYLQAKREGENNEARACCG